MTFIAKIRKNVDKIFSIIFDRGPLIKFYFFHELKINYFFKTYNLIKIFLLKFEKMSIKYFR